MEREDLERNIEKHREEFEITVKKIEGGILDLLEGHPGRLFTAEEILNHLGISIENGFPSIYYGMAFDAAWAELIEKGLMQRLYDEEIKFGYFRLTPIGDQVEKWFQKNRLREALQ